jgi:hypothetical protein
VGTRSLKGITMNTTRALLALPVAALGLVGALAPPATAAAASERTVPTCTLRAVAVTALDLRDDGQAFDEVRVHVGTQTIAERTYFQGQKRNTLSEATDTFQTTRRVRLVERGPGFLGLQTAPIACANAVRTVELSDGDARYEVIYIVQVL